ncbi:Uncharacterised protein [Nocardia asteroides]|nr:hypothetical protein SAMN05444423_101346 [Nocardia asteroides]VEG32012.1 Uncharacterised protein [Nocardia asteroides]
MARSVPQPPFPSELLADLHADNLAPELREQLWPKVSTDPDALHYLSQLDEVNLHLRALATDDPVMHPMPDDVADRMFRFIADLDLDTGDETTDVPSSPEDGPTERLSTLLAAQEDGPTERLSTPLAATEDGPTDRLGTLLPAQEDGPTERLTASSVPAQPPVAAPVSLAQYRSRRRMGWLAAAAATVAVLASAGAVVSTLDTTDGTPTAAPIIEPDPGGDELTTAAALSALGKREVSGPLGDEGALARCVQANGVDRAVLGASNITYRGADAVLVLVIGPKPPTITALVVGAGCTTGAPEQLALRDIG